MSDSIVNLGKHYKVEYKSRKSGNWVFLHFCRTLQTAKGYARTYGENMETRIITLVNDNPVRVSYFDGKDFHSERC